MKNQTETEVTETEPISQLLELSIVQGDSSGIFTVDERTGTTVLADDLSWEQWRIVLRLARTARKKAAVMVADCIEYGLKKWGRKKVDEALEQLQLELTLVKTAVAVNSVSPDVRQEHLNDDHYIELSRAQLPKAKALRWARIASDQRLTAAQLRLSIGAGEVVDRSAPKAETGIFTVQGIRQSFDVWYRRVGGINGVKAMDVDHQIEILEELETIVEFGLALDEHLHTLQNSADKTNEANNNAA